MQPFSLLLFNHIPKTGGVTLRAILNKVYGEKHIFQIKSTNIGESLNRFKNLSEAERQQYSVISGHGAELFMTFTDHPFRLTVFREPVSQFISQYHYLKNTTGSGFYEELKELDSLGDYLDFAIENGQDNLLTRYLSNSVQFLADPSLPIPNMQNEGNKLLEKAMNTMRAYDAVIDLADFDAGVFALARKLGWKHIPVYRPGNRNRNNPGIEAVPRNILDAVKEALRWDIILYDRFREEKLDCGQEINRRSAAFNMFQLRQAAIYLLIKIPRIKNHKAIPARKP